MAKKLHDEVFDAAADASGIEQAVDRVRKLLASKSRAKKASFERCINPDYKGKVNAIF